MPFKKGASGNPGGRPKTAIGLRKELVRRYGDSGKKLLDELDKLQRSNNERVRLDALKLAMAYHFGQPTQRVEASVEETRQVPEKVTFVFSVDPEAVNRT